MIRQEINFNFYGINLKINFNQGLENITENFLTDFEKFKVQSSQDNSFSYSFLNNKKSFKKLIIELNLTDQFCSEEDFSMPLGRIDFYFKSLNRKTFKYTFKSHLLAEAEEIYHKDLIHFILKTNTLNSAEEILFYYIHSVVGEQLEIGPFVRIHGGLISYNNQNFLLLGDSGAGKSTLCYRALINKWTVISEEVVLIHSQQLSLHSLSHLIYLKESNQNQKRPVAFNYFNTIETPILLNSTVWVLLGPFSLWKNSWNLFWGIGLPQMWVYVCRPSFFINWLRISQNRLKLLFLFKKSRKLILPKYIDLNNRINRLKDLVHSRTLSTPNYLETKEFWTENQDI